MEDFKPPIKLDIPLVDASKDSDDGRECQHKKKSQKSRSFAPTSLDTSSSQRSSSKQTSRELAPLQREIQKLLKQLNSLRKENDKLSRENACLKIKTRDMEKKHAEDLIMLKRKGVSRKTTSRSSERRLAENNPADSNRVNSLEKKLRKAEKEINRLKMELEKATIPKNEPGQSPSVVEIPDMVIKPSEKKFTKLCLAEFDRNETNEAKDSQVLSDLGSQRKKEIMSPKDSTKFEPKEKSKSEKRRVRVTSTGSSSAKVVLKRKGRSLSIDFDAKGVSSTHCTNPSLDDRIEKAFDSVVERAYRPAVDQSKVILDKAVVQRHLAFFANLFAKKFGKVAKENVLKEASEEDVVLGVEARRLVISFKSDPSPGEFQDFLLYIMN